MKKRILGGLLEASEISMGCMRIGRLSDAEAAKLIQTTLDNGINFFDHADIYSNGLSEEIFGKCIKKCTAKREDILIQSKCGIRKDLNTFDFSKEHIIKSAENSLKRLQTDYLDVLLLHRPDTLFEPEEVAEAFGILEKSGKVRYFGVSNQSPRLMDLLQASVKQKLIVNQLQFSIAHALMINHQFQFNMLTEGAVNRSDEVLEYCRLKGITIQAWSPFQHGFFKGTFIDNDDYKELNRVLDRIAIEKGVPKSAVVAAWILRHPAKMQVIVGTMNARRITDICKASDITLLREEWYEIYCAAGNILP